MDDLARHITGARPGALSQNERAFPTSLPANGDYSSGRHNAPAHPSCGRHPGWRLRVRRVRIKQLANDEKAESPPFLSPRARHLLKSALAFSLTLALYGPVLKAFDLPTGSPVFALSSVI